MKKTLFVFIVITIIMTGITVNAYDPSQIQGNTSGPAVGTIKSIGEKILGIVQTVGTISAVITLIIIGIKYLFGSAEEKAEYKKTLMPYLIGAVLVLAAANITKWIYDATQGLF